MKISLNIDESGHLEQGSLKSHFVGKVDSAASPHGQIDVNEGAGHMGQGQVGHHLHIFTIKNMEVNLRRCSPAPRHISSRTLHELAGQST